MAKSHRSKVRKSTAKPCPNARPATELTIRLAPDEQFAFWNALRQAPKLTADQRQLAAIMRGELKA